jgi:hypothetical protein
LQIFYQKYFGNFEWNREKHHKGFLNPILFGNLVFKKTVDSNQLIPAEMHSGILNFYPFLA